MDGVDIILGDVFIRKYLSYFSSDNNTIGFNYLYFLYINIIYKGLVESIASPKDNYLINRGHKILATWIIVLIVFLVLILVAAIALLFMKKRKQKK